MQTYFGAKTDVGLRRTRNEDSLCADPTVGLYVVCDGVGGRDAGDIASGLAVELIRAHVQKATTDLTLPLVGEADERFSPHTNRLASAIRAANQAIVEVTRKDEALNGMATTVVAALITDQVLSVAHVGDSRMYLLRGDTLRPLTTDHSLVVEQVRRGTLTEEEAERSPQRNIVTRALGATESVEVELDEVQLKGGDVILLCSDGLTRGVKPERMMDALRAEPDPQVTAERLIDLATVAGGEDNTTVIVIAVQGLANGTLLGRLRHWWRR